MSDAPAPNVAVFGGSFNPPHLAHVLAVASVLALYPVDRVLVIPTYRHPFGKPLAPYEDRVRMCELAMGWLPRVSISRVEEELGGESRTVRTLEALVRSEPSWRLRLVLGADILLEAHKWYGFDRIREIAPPIVLGRAGVTVAGAPPPLLPAVSSTEIRAHVRAGRWDEVAAVVPHEVVRYLRERSLYADAP